MSLRRGTGHTVTCDNCGYEQALPYTVTAREAEVELRRAYGWKQHNRTMWACSIGCHRGLRDETRARVVPQEQITQAAMAATVRSFVDRKATDVTGG